MQTLPTTSLPTGVAPTGVMHLLHGYIIITKVTFLLNVFWDSTLFYLKGQLPPSCWVFDMVPAPMSFKQLYRPLQTFTEVLSRVRKAAPCQVSVTWSHPTKLLTISPSSLNPHQANTCIVSFQSCAFIFCKNEFSHLRIKQEKVSQLSLSPRHIFWVNKSISHL